MGVSKKTRAVWKSCFTNIFSKTQDGLIFSILLLLKKALQIFLDGISLSSRFPLRRMVFCFKFLFFMAKGCTLGKSGESESLCLR